MIGSRRLAAVRAVCALGVTTALLLAGCGTGDEVAAEVDGTEYLVDDLHAFLATVDPDNDATASRAYTADWLGRWVFFTAVEKAMAERGVAVTDAHEAQAVADLTGADPSFVPGAAGGDLAVHQRAVVVAVQEWTVRELPDPDPDEVVARYLCSNHILVASSAEADTVLARLDAGESFGALAIDLSLDTGSGSLGGELGCVTEGEFVAPFEEAAYGAGPGNLVVAESQFGFHVIDVLSVGTPTAENHPHLDPLYLQQLAQDARAAGLQQAQAEVQTGRQQLLASLEADTFSGYADEVYINDRYGRWNPADFVVVPDPVG